MTSGCNKLDVYDWLADMDMPTNYKPFNIVEVRFKGSRKDFYVNPDNLYLEMGEMVAVEPNTGGYDIGHVSMTGELVRLQLKKNNVDPSAVSKKVYRKVTDADIKKWQAAKDLEWETMHKARKMALDLGLSMKISDVDFQGDKSKATFYYTADGRVDFRELIKRMAEAFRVRIEMRQIGMRQEASRLGGIGSCGRELCCSTWLTDFKTVSTSAARYQNLSLNTLKLAGQCGKLKCCLNYELDSYMDALKDIPNNIERIETQKGTAFLQKTDIFKKLMWFSYPGEENWIPLTTDRVKEIHQLNKEGVRPDDIGAVVIETVEEKPVSYDYENVVGQDSLTRLDERNKKKKRSNKSKRKGGGKKETKEAAAPEASGREAKVSGQKQAAPKQGAEAPGTGNGKPAKARKRSPGRQRKGKAGGQQQTKPQDG
ncbi:Cell fate regulator YaaT, PSP1 superfamily (controls sporulation, competence, biofilm development) [Parapedobacter composti]|uniref:Cell fate regulator YaaT, PSP1 superfamily (Controls sporulation, competence, biofilm development) n=1 Tax=Parapedobacter composti TaxID=623281 RepID=A0A1I1IGV0_9SPHI|nr:regulatory iron-sulfur-containing complex subunit RicT [Parapedobacter composti]SFC34912.1 Cell fate regulator YaaT, PSP1 superfamily (controls sporulation, competence, biofilm development) [Parapedobacter composti]